MRRVRFWARVADALEADESAFAAMAARWALYEPQKLQEAIEPPKKRTVAEILSEAIRLHSRRR